MSYVTVAGSFVVGVLLAGTGAAVATGALAPDSVGSRAIKDGAVRTRHLAQGAVTGAKVRESTLGTVPSARSLAGAPPPSRVSAAVGRVVELARDGSSVVQLRCSNPTGGPVASVEVRALVDDVVAVGTFTSSADTLDPGDPPVVIARVTRAEGAPGTNLAAYEGAVTVPSRADLVMVGSVGVVPSAAAPCRASAVFVR